MSSPARCGHQQRGSQGLILPRRRYNAWPSFNVNDQGNSGLGGAKSASGSIALTIDAINDPPILSIASPIQTINEDTTRVFSSGNGNLISISDVDAGTGALQVTLTATNGTLTLSRITGLTFSTGDGTADAGMVFTGTLSAINAALAGMSFAPVPTSTASHRQVDVDDQGTPAAARDRQRRGDQRQRHQRSASRSSPAAVIIEHAVDPLHRGGTRFDQRRGRGRQRVQSDAVGGGWN
jgi:hypothetical protein